MSKMTIYKKLRVHNRLSEERTLVVHSHSPHWALSLPGKKFHMMPTYSWERWKNKEQPSSPGWSLQSKLSTFAIPGYLILTQSWSASRSRASKWQRIIAHQARAGKQMPAGKMQENQGWGRYLSVPWSKSRLFQSKQTKRFLQRLVLTKPDKEWNL